MGGGEGGRQGGVEQGGGGGAVSVCAGLVAMAGRGEAGARAEREAGPSNSRVGGCTWEVGGCCCC